MGACLFLMCMPRLNNIFPNLKIGKSYTMKTKTLIIKNTEIALPASIL